MDALAREIAEVLREHGLGHASVERAGPRSEIAVVRARPGDWDRLLGEEGRALAARLRALGFRHVALELEAE